MLINTNPVHIAIRRLLPVYIHNPPAPAEESLSPLRRVTDTLYDIRYDFPYRLL